MIPLTAARRDGRVRELAFHLALLAAMLLGFMALFSLALALEHGVDASVIAALGVFSLAALLTWSLSRPTAKAWFTAPARPA
ncbi:MAG TPA: hypothetical protein VFP50_15835 [Anaeromyxobacteraceae bacterium]|nr:hypothetical protein [Anaeromyxobacteraceae bacterium]